MTATTGQDSQPMTAPISAVQPPNRRNVAAVLRQIVGAAGAVTGPRDHRIRHAILEAAKALEHGRDPVRAAARVYGDSARALAD